MSPKRRIASPQIGEGEVSAGLLEGGQDSRDPGGEGVNFVERIRGMPLDRGPDGREPIEDVAVEPQHLSGQGAARGQFPDGAAFAREGLMKSRVAAASSSESGPGFAPGDARREGRPDHRGRRAIPPRRIDSCDRFGGEGGFQFWTDRLGPGFAIGRGMEKRLTRHRPAARVDSDGALGFAEKRLRRGCVQSTSDSVGSLLDPGDEGGVVAFPRDLAGPSSAGLGLVVECRYGERGHHQEDCEEVRIMERGRWTMGGTEIRGGRDPEEVFRPGEDASDFLGIFRCFGRFEERRGPGGVGAVWGGRSPFARRTRRPETPLEDGEVGVAGGLLAEVDRCLVDRSSMPTFVPRASSAASAAARSPDWIRERMRSPSACNSELV